MHCACRHNEPQFVVTDSAASTAPIDILEKCAECEIQAVSGKDGIQFFGILPRKRYKSRQRCQFL
jgi:hypothetical protein